MIFNAFEMFLRLALPWSFPLVIGAIPLLVRVIKDPAHGVNFEHIPVEARRALWLCAE